MCLQKRIPRLLGGKADAACWTRSGQDNNSRVQFAPDPLLPGTFGRLHIVLQPLAIQGLIQGLAIGTCLETVHERRRTTPRGRPTVNNRNTSIGVVGRHICTTRYSREGVTKRQFVLSRRLCSAVDCETMMKTTLGSVALVWLVINSCDAKELLYPKRPERATSFAKDFTCMVE
eukprot:scaffold834_cov172-Amphora_coffeaeformis.AAC.3